VTTKYFTPIEDFEKAFSKQFSTILKRPIRVIFPAGMTPEELLKGVKTCSIIEIKALYDE
jgi:hypothetical protein